MPNAQMLTTECFLLERQTRRSSCHVALLKDKPAGDEKTWLQDCRTEKLGGQATRGRQGAEAEGIASCEGFVESRIGGLPLPPLRTPEDFPAVFRCRQTSSTGKNLRSIADEGVAFGGDTATGMTPVAHRLAGVIASR
jgi:hypothetical protein